MVGKGNMIPHYKKYCKKLDIADKVIFTGFIKEEILINLYRNCNILILPSTTIQEGFGMVAIEANATGLPVITVDHPQNAAKDFIEDDKYICKLSSIEIAQKISELLNSNKIHTFYKNYDWNNITKKIEKYYREINFK